MSKEKLWESEEPKITSMGKEEAIQIDDKNNANKEKGKEPEFTSMKEDQPPIDDENDANRVLKFGGKGKELEFTTMVKEEVIQIDDENKANPEGEGKELKFTSMAKEDANQGDSIEIEDQNNADQGKGKELEFTSMVEEEEIQFDNDINANQGGKYKELEFTNTVKEEMFQIDDENNANQAKENSADGEIITKEFTEKFAVQKKKGTPLKDICNVVSKLEEKVHSFSTTLHFILYGEHYEVEDIKKDVLEFSGFASKYGEGSQRERVKERLQRCPKDMLKQLCDVFDVSAAIYATNKNKLVAVLLDFLEAPYGATEETESSDKEIPSRKRKLIISEKKLYSETDTSTSLEIFHDEDEDEDDNESDETWMSGKSRHKSEKFKGKDVNLTKQIGKMNECFKGDATSSSGKITKSLWDLEKANKKNTERRVAQDGDKQPKEWCDPSFEEIQRAIFILLEEMDITTATFSDVLEELGEHLEMDISPRKDAIMIMIEEELYRLADKIQEQESCEENQAEKAKEKQENENKSCMQVPCGAPDQI